MDNITDIYNKNKKNTLGNNLIWLEDFRNEIINGIKKEGLPNKKNEKWKYSDLNNINNIRYKQNIFDKTVKKQEIESIDLIDGRFYISEELKDNENISIQYLNDSIKNLKNYFYFKKNLFIPDFATDINTVFLSDGLTISLNENKSFCLNINYQNITNEITGYIRNIIKVCKGSKLILIENFTNTESRENSTNIFNNFWLEKDSTLEHYIIQNLNFSANLIYSSVSFCYENSQFNQLSFQSGSRSVKNQHTTNLLGANSSVNHNGIYFSKKKQFIENQTSVNHHVANCQSNQIYKGVLTDESTGVYLSNTKVESEAQKTQGYQLSRGILLSDNCKLNTKPELKINADDVKCSHGSTIGAIDDNQTFYLQSRGLDKNQSENLLIKAFYKDVLKLFTNNKSIEKINHIVESWLGDR